MASAITTNTALTYFSATPDTVTPPVPLNSTLLNEPSSDFWLSVGVKAVGVGALVVVGAPLKQRRRDDCCG
jgi:hypothetical protein